MTKNTCHANKKQPNASAKLLHESTVHKSNYKSNSFLWFRSKIPQLNLEKVYLVDDGDTQFICQGQ